MIIIAEHVLDRFRTPGLCECCGFPCERRQPHHLQSRGHGGGYRLDVSINLVALHPACHAHIQENWMANNRLRYVVAQREGTNVVAIQYAMYALNDVTHQRENANVWLTTLEPAARALCEEALRESEVGAEPRRFVAAERKHGEF